MVSIGRTWSLDGINIAVTHDSLDYREPKYVKHSVLDTLYTDLQWFGSGEILRDLRGILFSGHDAVLGLVGSGYYTLISDQGAEGDYFLSNLSSERKTATNYVTPVYQITMKLRKELT